MLEWTFMLLDDSRSAESSVRNPFGHLGRQPDGPVFSNLGQSQAVVDSRPHPSLQTGKRSIGSSTKITEDTKLINGGVVLWLLFKYIPKPTMEDMENIAKDTDCSFDFVIDSYCKYRKDGGTNSLTSSKFAIVGQSMPNSRAPGIPKAGVTTDSAYGAQIEEATISNAQPPIKRVRLDGNAILEPSQSVDDNTQNKPHRCPQCNRPVGHQSDLMRYITSPAPGKFHFSRGTDGKGKVFASKVIRLPKDRCSSAKGSE
jgi:hypothetical protein